MATSLQHLREITNLDSVSVTDVLQVRFFFLNPTPSYNSSSNTHTHHSCSHPSRIRLVTSVETRSTKRSRKFPKVATRPRANSDRWWISCTKFSIRIMMVVVISWRSVLVLPYSRLGPETRKLDRLSRCSITTDPAVSPETRWRDI